MSSRPSNTQRGQDGPTPIRVGPGAGIRGELALEKEFPRRQKAASFGIDQVIDQLTSAGTGSN